MFQVDPFKNSPIARAGLNLQHVFDIAELPDYLSLALDSQTVSNTKYRQLLLFGHAGRVLWQSIPQHYFHQSDPIDRYCKDTVDQFFKQYYSNARFEVLYPAPQHRSSPINLQGLGELAGWHQCSPFGVGVNPVLGSWFAYRIVIVADTTFPLSKKHTTVSPCDTCVNKPCITRCPAQALTETHSNWQKCLTYRKQDHSLCRSQCIARLACPIGKEFQYSDEQIAYHYQQSLKHL